MMYIFRKREKENMKIKKVLFSLLLLGATFTYASITGTVYKDFDLNGQKNGNDAAVSGASVKAVCEDGNTYTASTDANGTYTLIGFPAGNKCRVEVDVSSAGLDAGANAQGSNPLVAIVPDGGVHDVSASSPATYCQANPDVIMVTLPGYHQAGVYNAGGGTPPLDNAGTVYKVPAPANGVFNNNDTITSVRATLSTKTDTGAVWGAAYQKRNKALFAAATLKRYVPLKDESSANAIATSAGTIYKIDTTTNAVTPFVVVPNVLSTQAQNELVNRDYGLNKDLKVVEYAGREGLGDIDISEDETKLYVVNMYAKALVTIDTNSGNILSTTPIPNPYTNAECTADKVRPWALKVRGDDVFIGSVCEDKIESDVGAAIQKYNGAIFQTVAQTNSLQYLRARLYMPNNKAQDDGYRYENWAHYTRDGAMLTDIEFTNSGDLVLGYISRATYNRVGSLRGDIRKMCFNPDGSYTDESSDKQATTCTTHTVNYAGNPTVYREFYVGDYFGANYGESGHPETAFGALAQAPGASNIIVGMVDGTDWYQPGSIGNYDNATGEKVGAQAVIDKNPIAQGGEREMYGSKAGGLGDVELLCDPAPIEIGNYVWEDVNGDGIQDPNEPPLAGIPVKLYDDAGNLLGTVTTDVNGRYYFGGENNASGVNIQPNTAYQLRIAQADVNGKTPTTTNPNGDNNDTIDNDATVQGADNVISFTTGVNNDHSLDFGIEPTVGCVQGTLFLDINGDGIQNGTDTVAPAGITVNIKDKYGNTHTAVTDVNGFYQVTDVPAGSITVHVDTTDADIQAGAVFANATSALNLPESTPGGNPAVCSVVPFPYILPAPEDVDPKDVATCAKATSLTWSGSTQATQTVWQNLLAGSLTGINTVDDDGSTGGTSVGVTMSITDNDGKFYDTDTANTSGAGTSAAFGQPYLTLYLGNQAALGNGNYNSPGNCAANGYELEAGQSATLTVEFDQEVILDNWRIRDVDSGDVRGAESDWEWQDAIEVKGYDAAGNLVAVESKIGSSGNGLIVDTNGLVHTDKDNYNAGGGDFITGAGTVPNATNGHIVLSSNFVPIKKIEIIHSAGPDVPCQTRSALAMEGFAVCAPLKISGTVYNDADGVSLNTVCNTSNNKVDGNPVASLNGTPLNACLLDSANIVVDTQPVETNGTYEFKKYIQANSSYKVLLTDANCTKGKIAPTASLPVDWHYEGEQIDPAANVGHDGTPDGLIDVNVTDANVPNVDFALNKIPTAMPFTRPAQPNPGGTTQVPFDPSGQGDINAFITDNEQTTPTRIKIQNIPPSVKVYYDGAPVADGTVIDNPDIQKFSIDPEDGIVEAGFEYVSMDSACRESLPALLKASFTEPSISGILFLDTNGNGEVDGNATAKSCDGTTPLYIHLVDPATSKVINSVALEDDGSYVFHYDDVKQNTEYELILSQTKVDKGGNAPIPSLPARCSLVGENKGSTPNNPEGTPANGKISVSVGKIDIPELNFAIAPIVKIGDKVWIEDDNDGDATTGTVTPVVGVTVTADCGDKGTFTAVTDSNGLYAIDVPQNSTCSVSVPVPLGKVATAGSQDADVTDTTSENDKSHNPNGTTVTVGTIDNMSVDFGFTDPTTAIGNLFWIDNNANGKVDGGEKGYNGVKVTLMDANGTVIETQTTRNGPDGKPGYYLFDNLAPNKEYKVHFDYSNVPALKGYVYSPQVGGNDANNVGSQGFTVSVTPGAGEQILTLDAGINCGCSNGTIKANGGDALGMISVIFMMLMTLLTALFFVRKEEIQNV